MELSISITRDLKVRIRLKFSPQRAVSIYLPSFQMYCMLVDKLTEFRNKIEAIEEERNNSPIAVFINSIPEIDKIGGK